MPYSQCCLRCGFKWESWVPHPRVCVRCKSHYWDIPHKRPKKNTVAQAGHLAQSPAQDAPVVPEAIKGGT